MRFERDPVKARLNIARRGISFHEAASVFGDPFAVTIPDTQHDTDEPRELTIGMSASHRILVVYHVDRGSRLRVIGAREPTKQERHVHQEGPG